MTLAEARDTAAAAEELRTVQRSLEIAAGGECHRAPVAGRMVEGVCNKLLVADTGQCGVEWREDDGGRRFVRRILDTALHTKRDMVQYLQAHVGDEESLRKHKLNGQEQSVVKDSSEAALRQALSAFLGARKLDRLRPSMQLIALH